ncbi:hypothetical protein QWY85_07920 [Neolewinella lacunae]|uniref:Uncharacterized protein n=1 Tax=Neolewinella lacunae TaxID=1517758 RepID=A0A923TDD1_9BACT|nr:hypothetical protein [Neolewinella lacunae]MBC6994707.1 hypothetical protein [Neolewinella lacunae]MDN3634579.1 hypothetical protein [Neolewinella lacunae]
MSLLNALIADLSPADVRRATDWLACPLHNQRADVVALFRLRTARDAPTTPEAEYTLLFPDATYHAARHRQVEHQLLRRLEAFLAYDQYQRDHFAPDRYLLQAYRERGLDDHRRTRLRRYQPGQETSIERLGFDYFHAREEYDLNLGNSRGGKDDFRAPEEHLERYLLALRLRQTCNTLAHQRLHQSTETYAIPRLRETLAAAASADHRATPFIYLYHLVALLQLDEDGSAEDSFHLLLSGLEQEGSRLPEEDLRNLLLLAINYGLRRANTGWEPAISTTFALYKLGLERGSLYDRGKLSVFTFNNVLALALRLREVAWASRFLEEHQADLPEGGEEVIALGRARLALANGKDGEALRYLQQADFHDFIHHLTARVLQLKIYFRQDSYTLLSSHISSTRKLLTRRRGIGYHLQNYRHIFALADTITRLPPGDEKARTLLKEKIEKTEPCTEKPWLLECLEAFAKRR